MVPKRRIFGEINYPQLNQKTAIQFLDDVLERLPFRMEVIQLLIHLLVMRTPGERGLTRAASRRQLAVVQLWCGVPPLGRVLWV